MAFTPFTGGSPSDQLGADQNSVLGGYKGDPSSSVSLDSPQGLLALAQAHGGSVGEAANELVHPTTSILSTIGNGFKNAFSGFVDLISIPSEIVAGAIDPNKSIGEAIDQHERVSDVVFGKRNPNASTVQKVGGFFARTAVDILTDPLTYLSFGAAQGIFGLKSFESVSLGVKAAEETGAIAKGADMTSVITKSLSRQGQDVKSYLNLLKKQIGGTQGLEDAVARAATKAGPAGEDAAKEFTSLATQNALDANKLAGGAEVAIDSPEFKQLLADTINAPLNIDFAKRAITNIMEAKPALANTLLDKGGIKAFGNTVLSGQRIQSVLATIPGMTALDTLTSPTRLAMGALFNPAITKVGSQYVRIPEEMVHFTQQAKDFAEATGIDSVTSLSNIIRENKLTAPELDKVMAAVTARKLPADPRLAAGYMQLMGLKQENKAFVEARGGHISTMEQHTGNVFVGTDVNKVSYAGKASGKIGAASQASNAKFIAQTGNKVGEELPTLEETLSKYPGGKQLASDMKIAGSTQEAGFALGKHVDEYVQHLLDGGMDFQTAFKDAGLQDLIKLRGGIDSLPQNIEHIGHAESFGLTATEDLNFFKNNEGTIFKRVGASAQELKASGIEGFDTNLATSMATRFVQNINQGISHEFVQNFGRFFGKVESEAGHGWVELSLPKSVEAAQAVMSGEEKILFHPAMAQAAQDMFKSLTSDPATSDFLKAFDKIQQYWKASVTSIFPQFHGRNAISNVLLNFLDLGYHAFNPATHTAALDLLNKDRQANNLARTMVGSGAEARAAKTEYEALMNTHVYTDAMGGTYTFGELRQAAKTRGVAFNKNQLGQIDLYGDKDRLFSQLAPYSKSTGKKVLDAANIANVNTFAPVKYGTQVGNMIESQARLVNFLSNLKATGDVAHAAQRTKQFLFDYSNLTNFEKTVMRRILPFYSFTRKNLELQVNTLLSTPGRIESQLTTLGTLGDTLSGNNLSDKEKAALPDWVKSGIGVLATKKGETVSILTGFGTPIEQPFQQFQPNQLLGSISPIIRVPTEQMSGYSFFQGKMLSDVTNAAGFKNAPTFLKSLIGYTEIQGKRSDGSPFTWYTSLNPSMMNLLLNLPPTSRVFGALKQMDAVDVTDNYKVLQQITGIKPYSFDLVQEQAKRQKELQGKLEDLLTKAGVTAQFTKTFVPKASN